VALSFVNIIVAQIWLIATIFGLLMAISCRQAGRSSSGGGVGNGTPLCGGLLEVLLTTSASTCVLALVGKRTSNKSVEQRFLGSVGVRDP
jgi:hypothetical protein